MNNGPQEAQNQTGHRDLGNSDLGNSDLRNSLPPPASDPSILGPSDFRMDRVSIGGDRSTANGPASELEVTFVDSPNADLLEKMAALYAESFRGPPWNERWTGDEAKVELESHISSGGEFFICISEDGTVLGQAIGIPMSKSTHLEFFAEYCTPDETYYFAEFCVSPQSQGRGLGTKLLQAACDSARKQGYLEVSTRTRDDNISAIRAFQKLDFEHVGTKCAVTGGEESNRVVYRKRYV